MSLFHKNKKNVNHGIKKMDAIITGLVLGGIVASVYGIKKYEQEKEKHSEEVAEGKDSKAENKSILKALIFGYKEEKVEQTQPSLIRRIIASPFILIKRLGKK